LSWDDAASASGPSIRYDVLGGALSDLAVSGIAGATACVASDLASPTYLDTRADPLPGDGIFYLVRSKNPCGVGPPLTSLDCTP
jgi:hypothetical protein